MKQDLFNNLSIDVQLSPIAITSTTDLTGTDLQGFQSACFVLDAGLWVDGTHTFLPQESTDNAAWTTVAAGNLDGSLPATILGVTNDNQVYKVGYRGNLRYIRVLNTVTAGPGTGLVMGVSILRGHPESAPV